MITTIQTLLDRAAHYGLKLVTDKTELDRSGLDFLVLHASDENGVPWIVRTPRHPKAYEGTVNEGKMLRLLRERLTVAVPEWRIHERDVIAYPRLPGTPAWTYDPEKGLTWNGLNPGAPQAAFLESSARFLAELHGTEKAAVEAAGGRVRPVSDVRRALRDACESTRSVLNPSETLWRRWQNWLQDDSYWPAESRFIHGDLHPGHMLLDDTLSLTGVLDWTEAEVADPAADFTIFFGCFGRETLLKFVELYKKAGGKPHERLSDHVIERWAAYAPMTAHWGMTHQNQDVIDHAKAHLAATEEQARSDA